ncbi:hypothetical protein ACFJIX_06500 [Roseateles sp. UC29_93]|uniref:hypothetical protein n=1 Tax=Roseateles sp. UC29_93 TaxID=3350177 RepID=UPI0002E50C28
MTIDLDLAAKLPDGLLPIPLIEERVLYEAEQPIVYLTRNSHRQIMLAYLAGEDAHFRFTLLAPISGRDLRLLEQGQLSIRDALTGTWMWLLRESQLTGEFGLWAVSIDQMPRDHLPAPGTPLLPEHDLIESSNAPGTHRTSVVAPAGATVIWGVPSLKP